MSEQYNELAQYFDTSPNLLVAGCMNTHEHTDGVVFPGIEPQEDTFCFVGRASITAAMAELYQTTVSDVLDRMETATDLDQKLEMARLKRENKELTTMIGKIEKLLS